ncbi:hypothetical protein PHLGIDRAFT_471502 [Phlebiopsis gigantea 11061_1 CR5-6]|uniref:Uncharacterized protein n=1 Tax=Phlebiopsis gigantea (strain 11061_1 CR5-6) TaxID=745531 RepID=A0A0C3NM02_PHLG1|nr:hypothetical protein PHLGIDRAFT_471502 [Phlebiopsis gigantea 11061_1 CR5-6]
MRRELTRAPSNVRKENKKRVQYFAAINKKLKLIDIYEDYLEVLGESDDDEDYEALEDLRQKWRRLEIKDIKSRLDQFHYRLQDIEYVKLVLGNRRLEHSILTLAYILLYRHMKIVKLARHKVISPQEFEDMRDTWESIFSAFETRFNVLVEMWRQQGRDLEIQSQCYCAGLFQDWYKRNLAYEDDYNMQDDSADDDDYYHDDGYSDVSDTEGVDSEPESEDGNGLRPPTRTNDIMSVVSSAMSAGPKDPSRLLCYSGAAALEDDEGLTTDAESDWLPPAIRKRKAEEELRERLGSVQDRLTGVEERLGSIESMLREILVFQYGQASGGVGMAKNSRKPSKAPRPSLTQPPTFNTLLGAGGGAGDAPQSGVGEDQSDADANDSGEDSVAGHESTGGPL